MAPIDTADDALGDFAREQQTFDGTTRTVYRKGEGPAVIVIAEIPGITPLVADFARRIADAGMTAVMPSLFGTDGKAPSNGYALASMVRACISSEFTTFVTGRTSPAAVWCRHLAAAEHARCGGPGVGAIGMCLTGNFALGMMVDPSVIAPALSQPSLPFPLTKKHRADLAVSDDDLAAIKARVAEDERLCVLGMRFSGDRLVPAERFARLEAELGDDFIGVTIDSSKGNPHGISSIAHSVVTEDLVDEPGHPTHDALLQVLEHFTSRLLPEGT